MILALLSCIGDIGAVTEPGAVIVGRVSYFHAQRAALGHPEKPFYCACRFDYRKLGKHIGPQVKNALSRDYEVVVWANRKSIVCQPVDWGPARWTRRVIDLSKAALDELGVSTDDTVSYYLRRRDEN